MKKLLLISLLVSAPAMADKLKACKSYDKAARHAMQFRQDGYRMVDLVELAPKEMIPIIKNAYKIPKYRTKKYRDNAVNEFANKYYLKCIES